MFQTNVYRGKMLINLEFKNNSGTSTQQGHSCSSMSEKSLHSDVEIPQLWENLQFNMTELVNSLISKINEPMYVEVYSMYMYDTLKKKSKLKIHDSNTESGQLFQCQTYMQVQELHFQVLKRPLL